MYTAFLTPSSPFFPRPRPRRARARVTCTAASPEPVRVLALGGAGRVGLSTLRALRTILPSDIAVDITLTSRSARRATSSATSLGGGARALTLDVDKDDEHALIAAMAGYDVVLNVAGPFQGRHGLAATRVAECAVRAGARAYVDVCDDAAAAADTAALSPLFMDAGVAGVVSAGVYPGVSNILAVQAVELLSGGDDDEEVSDLHIAYHTAGSGGIGATVLASTFLLLAEDAVVYGRGGKRSTVSPASQLERVDFGGKIGCRDVYALRLPEVDSLHTFVAPFAAISAKFSTAPAFWNALLPAMATIVPRDLLRDRRAMAALAAVSIPVVRAVDTVAGARTGIVVTARNERAGRSVRITYEHESLAQCVGEGTAAFVAPLVRQVATPEFTAVSAGMWFPEQLSAAVRKDIMKTGCMSCDRLDIESMSDVDNS